MREWELHLGDALQVLPGMPDGSADAVVTDPPAAISFMSLGFDTFKGRDHFIDWLAERMAQCLRVLKPGGYALVWALPRTSHWTATALEDAGFEIRDVVVHITGQGFPKGKACLKPAAEHWILCRRPAPRVLPLNIDECRVATGEALGRLNHTTSLFNGKNSTPWVDNSGGLGRYPANLVLSHHESCVCRGTKRVKAAGWRDEDGQRGRRNGTAYNCSRDGSLRESASAHHAGPDGAEEVEDWVCYPECPVFLLDSQAGELHTHAGKYRNDGAVGMYGPSRPSGTVTSEGNSGGASRFFYCAKADRADRGEGNDHPCTKSTALMQWLCKLVSRPGETVLDPFAGSGSTGVAALRCERRFVGIERDPHYHGIALSRLAAVDGPLFALPAGEAVP